MKEQLNILYQIEHKHILKLQTYMYIVEKVSKILKISLGTFSSLLMEINTEK